MFTFCRSAILSVFLPNFSLVFLLQICHLSSQRHSAGYIQLSVLLRHFLLFSAFRVSAANLFLAEPRSSAPCCCCVLRALRLRPLVTSCVGAPVEWPFQTVSGWRIVRHGRCLKRHASPTVYAARATPSASSTTRMAQCIATVRGHTRAPAPTNHHCPLRHPELPHSCPLQPRRHSRRQSPPQRLRSSRSPSPRQSSRHQCPPQQLRLPQSSPIHKM